MTIGPEDELDHFVGPTSAWTETWEFRLAIEDLSLAVVATVVRRPTEGRMSYWAAVLGRSRPSVALVEHDIDAPRVGLELRASGLWADHICEEPHRRWTLGLEAFALALDDPADLITTGRGLPVPLGFDLEWETPADPWPIQSDVDTGYVAEGTAHGEVLIGETTLAVDGIGHRLHRWGTGPSFPAWWSTAGTGQAGAPRRQLDPVAEVFVADSLDVVTRVSVGTSSDDGGSGAPVWASTHMAPAQS